MNQKAKELLAKELVKEGFNYLFNGSEVTVFMIHAVGRGNSMTLCDRLPDNCENPYPYLRKGTVRMMDFRKKAKILVMGQMGDK